MTLTSEMDQRTTELNYIDFSTELRHCNTKKHKHGNESLHVFAEDSKYTRHYKVSRPRFPIKAIRQSANLLHPSDYDTASFPSENDTKRG